MKNDNGFIALSTVLIISAVALSVAISVSLLSLSEAQSSFTLMKGEDALQFVEGCAEDALLKAQADASYNGGSISRPEGTCTISITKLGNTWTMTATTTNQQYKRTIEAVFQRLPTGITLTSWREI